MTDGYQYHRQHPRRRRDYSNALHQHRSALPSADAQRGDTTLAAGALEDLEHVQHDARAGCSDRVAERDRAAIDVQLRAVELAEGAVEAEVLLAVRIAFPRGEATQHLRGEGLVDLGR